MIWVLNTNSGQCRIYNYKKHPAELTLIKTLECPEYRLRNQDIVSDRPGHYHSTTTARGSYSPHLDAKHVELDNFSREIAKTLDHGRKERSFEKLIIIAPPHVSGLLLSHINKNVKELVTNHIAKELIHLTDIELLEYLKTHAQFPNGI